MICQWWVPPNHKLVDNWWGNTIGMKVLWGLWHDVYRELGQTENSIDSAGVKKMQTSLWQYFDSYGSEVQNGIYSTFAKSCYLTEHSPAGHKLGVGELSVMWVMHQLGVGMFPVLESSTRLCQGWGSYAGFLMLQKGVYYGTRGVRGWQGWFNNTSTKCEVDKCCIKDVP